MKGQAKTAGGKFVFLGNRLCIDFANTVYSPEGAGDALRSWRDLAAFLRVAGTVPERSALTARQPREVFPHALRLRDALRKVLAAIAAGETIRPGWVAPINAVLRARLGMEQLAAGRDGWRLRLRARSQSPLQVLYPVARSAAELIAECPGAPVRKCANPRCVLFFYDTSGKGRRWCSMQVCGNRAKVAAHAWRARR